MSMTTTGLATNAMSIAFERIESIYEDLVEQLHAQVLAWGVVDADVDAVQAASPGNLIEDIRRAAVTKWTLSRLIRTRPEELPPTNLMYTSSFLPTLVTLGDAVSLDDIAMATADLKQTIQGSSWDFQSVAAQKPAGEDTTDDGLGFNTDLGEVVPGPEEPSP
jgi:hypothetical protein